jgi:hypothetical protein
LRERDLEAAAADALSGLRKECEALAKALEELAKALEELGEGRLWRLKPEDYLDRLGWMPIELAALGVGVVVGARRLAEELAAMCRAMKVRRELRGEAEEP